MEQVLGQELYVSTVPVVPVPELKGVLREVWRIFLVIL